MAALATATAEVLESGKKANFRNVKKQLKLHIADFDEKKLEAPNGKPYRKFMDFAAEAENRGLVTLAKDGKTDVLVLPESPAEEAAPTEASEPEEAAPAPAEETPADDTTAEEAPSSEADDAAAEGDAEPAEANPLDAAYAQLVGAVADAIAEGKSTSSRALGSRFKKLDPVLDVKALTNAEGKAFKSINEFLVSAEAAGKIKLEGEGSKLSARLPD